MTERPILFSGPMVRALLDGRKTQTRRIITPGKWLDLAKGVVDVNGKWVWHTFDYDLTTPYGVPGDRLWVRETFSFIGGQGVWELRQAQSVGVERWVYRADGDDADRWWPSIHMPRAASRLTLEVIDVRVELVQNITRADAKAEGFLPSEGNGLEYWKNQSYGNAQLAFEACWRDLSGPASWDENPWVWVIEFRRVS